MPESPKIDSQNEDAIDVVSSGTHISSDISKTMNTVHDQEPKKQSFKFSTYMPK
ncbi:4345_t:CDS:2, partial [Acaulospora morrowiae]